MKEHWKIPDVRFGKVWHINRMGVQDFDGIP